ncbi:MAG: hypothetical protein KIT87_16485 [Anaerolineae bacterium]|nr:hypothetical protein [Anaerolineae bacterium]
MVLPLTEVANVAGAADGEPALPTWVQQAGYRLAPCDTAPTVSLSRADFGLFDVTYVDFRYHLVTGP